MVWLWLTCCCGSLAVVDCGSLALVVLSHLWFTCGCGLLTGGGVLTVLLWLQVDAVFCLSFVMPGCTVHISEMDISGRTADRLLALEEQTVLARTLFLNL